MIMTRHIKASLAVADNFHISAHVPMREINCNKKQLLVSFREVFDVATHFLGDVPRFSVLRCRSVKQ